MASVTVRSQVDSQGNLSVTLPDEFQGESVTVVVQVNPVDPIESLRKTAGSIPDLERPPQGDYEERLAL